MKERNIYVGVNQVSCGDEEWWELSCSALEYDETIKFEKEETARGMGSALSRAYYAGRRDAKKTLLDWINR